jgi:type III pantothenate kinase
VGKVHREEDEAFFRSKRVSQNILAISIGNTNIQAGVYIDGQLSETLIVRVGDVQTRQVTLQQAWDRIKDLTGAAVVVASVNPPAASGVVGWASEALKTQVYRTEIDLEIPVGRQLDDDTIVGEDRLLAAAAAYAVLKQAVVVVDVGTAITVDFVDGAGTFHGGAIAPGARMMLKALKSGTAQLPDVELAKPAEPIGHNTADAMLSGVFYGIRGMVRELVEQYAETAGSFPMVVATGGDAKLLFEDFDLVDRIVPELVLQGILVTAKVALDEDAG